VWKRNVGFVDVVVFCSSNLQQVSKLSGFLLYCICTCVTNIIFVRGEWMYLSYFCVVYGFQYLHFLKHYLSAVCFCCSSRRI